MLQIAEHIQRGVRAETLLPDFFEGRSQAWGMFEDPFGNVKRTFTAQIEGLWEEDVFVLDERFQFSDGKQDHRTWRLKYLPDGTFTAECKETVSPGTGRVVQDGCVLAYRFRLAIGARTITVKFNDLFRLLDDDTLINRSKVSKWGVPIGQVVAAFRRAP